MTFNTVETTSLCSRPSGLSLDKGLISRVITGATEGDICIEFGAACSVGFEGFDDMLPYDGVRNTVHRSSWAKTGMFVARTHEDGLRPRPIGFESSLERATAISALLHPNTYGLKCQPRKVEFDQPVGNVKSNTLDFLLEQKSGDKFYLFVKNEEALSRPTIERICREIRLNLPDGYGFAIISDAEFPPAARGNNERMFLAKRSPDDAADACLGNVLEELIDVARFTVEELVLRCSMGPRNADMGRAFDAILRAIADRKVVADRRELIDYPTVLGWPV